MRLTQIPTPSVPAFDAAELYFDSADQCLKGITSDGLVHILTRTRDGENFIINGGFDFWQRLNPNAQTTVSGSTQFNNFADRWVTILGSGQYNRVDTAGAPERGLSARYYSRWLGNGSGKRGFGQVLESTVSNLLAGRTVRFQIKLKCPSGSVGTVNQETHRVWRLGLLYTVAGTAVDAIPGARGQGGLFYNPANSDGTDPKWNVSIAQIPPVSTESTGVIRDGAVDCVVPLNAWTRFSATFVIPATAVNVMPFVWSNCSLALNDELHVSEAGLYLGQEVMDWSPRPFAQELALCQRYYCKTFNLETAPAQNVGVDTGEAKFIAGAAGAVALRSPSFPLPVQMFKTASNSAAVVFNPAAANANPRDETGAVDCTFTATQLRENSVAFTMTGNAATVVGNLIGVHFTVEADF